MSFNAHVVTHPLRAARVDRVMPDGLTVAEVLERVQPDPVLCAHARVFVDGLLVPPERWTETRPTTGSLLTARAFVPPTGGGGGGGKNPMRVLFQVATIAASFYFGPMLGGALGGISATAAKTATVFGSLTWSRLGSALIGATGMLLTNAVAPIRPPQLSSLSGTTSSYGGTTSSPTLFIEGARNTSRPFEVVPVHLGTTRVTPDLAARPYTETVGDQNYLRMLFCWGVGPLALSDFRIGDTDLDEFDGVQVEHREGYDDDEPVTLYPSVVDEDTLTVNLTEELGWQTRTTSAGADEVSIDLTFPRGLFSINSQGKRRDQSVTVQVQYSEADADSWQSIPTEGGALTFNESWTNVAAGEFDEVTFTHRKDAAVRHGITWKVPSRGQYDVRVRRTTEDSDSAQIIDDLVWTALRRITCEDPIDSPVPLALTALRIKASDQLNSIIDEFNGLATMVGTYYSTTSPVGWTEDAETNRPEACFRQLLQGNGLQSPLADGRLDLDTLAEWAEFCEDRGYTFNMHRDFSSSLWDALADVCAAGRAAPTQVDGKWSVVIDREQDVPVSYVTPRNSWGFSATKFFSELPHAFRVRFPNEDQDYRQDERRVYLDGYDASNATRFEALELPGVTDPNQVYRLGRFHAAAAKLRPERWEFYQELESMVYHRGDLILVTHDVLQVGLTSGRISGVTTDSAGDVTELELDTAVTMEEGTDYGLSIRTVGDVALTRQVVTNAGEQTTVVLSAIIPSASAPVEGDLFGFGELGSETDEALVVSVAPEVNFVARVAVVPYRTGVYDTEDETIPDFETNLTDRATVPAPTVLNVRSDESALAVGVGDTVVPRINVKVQPLQSQAFSGLEKTLVVRARPTETGEPYAAPELDRPAETEVFVRGVRTGERWDLRLRWDVKGRLPGPWAYVNGHRVVGKSTDPSALSGLTLSAFGGQAFLRWDAPSVLDVWFGGTVKFRHSQDMSSATWAESASIGTTVRARDLMATLPLKEGTYLARVYDQDGNPSDVANVTTKQAAVLTYASADTLDEAPSFGGDHDGTVATGGTMKLDGVDLIDDWGDVDDQANWDSVGGIELTGTYDFEFGFDLGAVEKVRLTTRLTVTSENSLEFVDDRTADIDDWEDFDGTTQAAADARVEARYTDDSPYGVAPDEPDPPDPYPAGLTPVVWWDFQDDGQVTKSGGKFTAVTDQGTAGADLAQGNATYQPTVGTLNGYQAAVFDSAHVMTSAGAETVFRNAAGITWAVALRLDTGAGTNVIAAARVGTSVDARFNVQHTDDDWSAVFRRLDADDADWIEGADELKPGQSAVVVCTLDFTNQVSQIWVNGTKVAEDEIASGPGSTSDTDSTRVMVGASSTLGQNGWDGPVGEVLGYDDVLDSTEIASLTEFLAGKWGVGTSDPDWSEWQRLDSAEFEARGFEFRTVLTTTDPAYNMLVTELGVDVEEVA